ncbi:UNVERIFIED_CONTAM: hypothetical protein HDU68_009342 [Siphonaria sp. JEL0065]|nr:hypothetical protein HDU68_009342 [Siphonaria sp. JEL0065]
MVLKNDDYGSEPPRLSRHTNNRILKERGIFVVLIVVLVASVAFYVFSGSENPHGLRNTSAQPDYTLCQSKPSLLDLHTSIATTSYPPLAKCVAARLQQAIRINTTSLADSEATLLEDPNSSFVPTSFLELHSYLRQEFPHVHNHFNVSVINKASLLFEPPDAPPKHLFYAHMDVVPGTGVDPFAGRYNDTSGTIHGRGALDMKAHLISFLSVMESLLVACDLELSTPQETCLERVNQWTIALGHDEETTGWGGAARIAQHLKDKGSSFDAIYDEGVPAIQNLIPLPGNPVLSFIGLAERGFLNVKFTISSEGGHSSVSKWSDNPANILSKSLDLIYTKYPFPRHSYSKPGIDTFKLLLLPDFLLKSSLFNVVFDLIGAPYVIGCLFSTIPMTAPFLSTSASVTQFFAGQTGITNVIPNSATALMNLRIHPSDSIDSSVKHLQAAMTEISKTFPHTVSYKLEVVGSAQEPSPVTPYDPPYKTAHHPSYHRLAQILQTTHAHHTPSTKILVGPAIMVAATDTKHFLDAGIIKNGNAFRVTPFVLTSRKQLGGIHGIDEFVSMDGVARGVEFYYRLVVD